MSENFSGNFELKTEKLPSFEEIWTIFERVLGDQKYKEVRKIEDEKGLKILEIKIPGDLEDLELGFTRKNSNPDSNSSVHTSYYDKEGNMLPGAEIVARYINGEWKISADLLIKLY